MKHTDDIVKQFLDESGIPWANFFLSASGLPSYWDEAGRLMTLFIEDDAMSSAVQAFLTREREMAT